MILSLIQEDIYPDVVYTELFTVSSICGILLFFPNLIINDYNDSIEEIEQLCDFVADELGPEVPLHFSRAFPYYKMKYINPTRPEILFKAREIAINKGIKNIHLGNI